MCCGKYLCLICGLSILLCPIAFALPTDREQPIQIEADSAVIDDAKGVATYQGNVIVTQGSIRIDAQTVTLNYTAQQTIAKVVATGKPARFKQTPHQDKADIKAKAGRMEYQADEDMLHLTEDAELQQAQDTFSGQRITYDTRRGIIRADKGNHKTGRIKVVIQPRQQEPVP
jgi:lipopolysaccharide export system protein LptA